MEQHFSQSAGLLLVTDILNSMMNMIIFDRAGNQWSLARAICSLIICHQQAFQYYKNQLIQKQPQEVHQRVQVCFQALMEGVTEDPSSANKDMFSSNITKFSTAIAEFCVRPDFN
jgi:exportin-7